MLITNEDCPVYLEPNKHVYIHKKTNEEYTSVTKLLTHFEEKFEAELVAEIIASKSNDRKKKEYVGLNKNEILTLWKKKNDDSNNYGTKVHNIIENYLNSQQFYFPDDEFEKKIISEFTKLEIDLGEAYYPERILFSEEHKLAGTSDLPIDIDDEYFDIWDYKTNETFNFYSKYSKLLLPPFDYLQDCQYSIYTLQLSVYALMYEMETGKKCRQLNLAHHNKETFKFERIPVIYMKNEAEIILDYCKKSQ